jgi:Flp pilus assembly protein TadD
MLALVLHSIPLKGIVLRNQQVIFIWVHQNPLHVKFSFSGFPRAPRVAKAAGFSYASGMSSEIRSASAGFLLLAAAAAVCVLVYARALDGPFVFDDAPNITENRHLRIRSLSPGAIAAAAFESPIRTRPLAYASFALNYYFGGMNPVGFRLVNLLLHIGSGLLVYALARTMLRTPALESLCRRLGRDAELAAGLAAALWLLHPLHTQSVAYIVQRMNGMAAFFYLAAVLAFARGRLAERPRRRAALFAACAASALLALASKEIAATLPVFLLLTEWVFFQNADTAWLRRRLPLLAAAAGALAVIGWIYVGGAGAIERVLGPYAGGGPGAGERMLTQLRVVVFYVSLMLWPHPARLNLDHDVVFSRSLVDPASTALALAAILAAAVAAALGVRRQPLAAFAVWWFLGNLVIESSVLPLEPMFEHRTYLPSVMPAVAAAALWVRYFPHRRAGVLLALCLAALWAGWTAQRNLVWQDDEALWADSLRKSPAKSRPYNNLGGALIRKGRFEEALPLLERAIAIRPHYADALYNLGFALMRLERIEAGAGYIRESLRLDPKNTMARNNLGIACMMTGDLAAAEEHFRETVRMRPDEAPGRNNLGVALNRQGRHEEAAAQLTEAIRINPRYAEAYNNLGIALREMGRLAEAVERFRHALRLQPDYPAARRNLSETEARMKPSPDGAPK